MHKPPAKAYRRAIDRLAVFECEAETCLGNSDIQFRFREDTIHPCWHRTKSS